MTDSRITRATGSLRAFTLIELLVVIAIISLLISILLPSLENARKQSKRAACASHLKHVATTSRVYESEDEQGWGIPVHALQFHQCENQGDGSLCGDPTFVGAYEWGGKSGVGRKDYLDGNPNNPVNSKYGTKAGFGPASRPMNKLLYGLLPNYREPEFNSVGARADMVARMELFLCPGDDGPPRGGHCDDWIVKGNGVSSYDWFGNSYAANIFMIASTGGSEMFSNSPYMRPITRLPTPARTIYYEENIGRWAWAAREDPCDFLAGIDVGPTKQLSGWHGQNWTYNRAFVDTHVEYQKIYFEGTEDSLGYAKHYRVEKLPYYPPWPAAGGPDPNDQGALETFYRCVIIRGPNWTKDTFPAQLIETGLDHPSGNFRPSYEDCVSD